MELKGFKNNPKVSIIMPVYNVENFLQRAIDSVVNQTLKDIELICIEDCSTDGSLKILQDAERKDSRIKLIVQTKNQGQGVARNIGLDLAKGDYIMFLDPDDWFELSACEDAYKQISENGNDMVFFNILTHNTPTNDVRIDWARLHPFCAHINNKRIKLSELSSPFMTTGEIWYKIYRTEFLKKNNIRFADVRLGEEEQFTTFAYLLADTVSVLPKCLYNYQVNRPESVSCADESYKFDIYSNEKDKDLAIISQNKDYQWLLSSFIPYYLRSLLYFYRKFRDKNPQDRKILHNKLRQKFINISRQYCIKDYVKDDFYKSFEHYYKYNYYQSCVVRAFKP